MAATGLEIVGAGPAGLAAALAARARGIPVTVFEKRADVGGRFHGDFQGLENWSVDLDVLTELGELGIAPSFDYWPVRDFVCFDASGRACSLQSENPVFYLVRRGSERGTLDWALKEQALAAGVDIRFGQRRRQLPEGGVVAEGPHRADVIATGYVFETDMADGCFAAIGDALAPAGYSYLLVAGGRGTVASCLFAGFHEEQRYLQATVEFFRRAAGLRWTSARRFGGSGNYAAVNQVIFGNRRYAGEAAGFQDALFGFGLRYALLSGYFAADATRYTSAWQARLAELNKASLVNRFVYRCLGDKGRQAILRWAVSGRDPRALLNRIYRPSPWKKAILPFVARPQRGRIQERADCDCTWCRCHRDHRAEA